MIELDSGHCPTCGARVALVVADEGTAYMVPRSDRVNDVFTCSNGHVVPNALTHTCGRVVDDPTRPCPHVVVYVPFAVELELKRELDAAQRVIEQLRARLEP